MVKQSLRHNKPKEILAGKSRQAPLRPLVKTCQQRDLLLTHAPMMLSCALTIGCQSAMHELTVLSLQKLHSLCLLLCCGSPGGQATLLAVLAMEAPSQLAHAAACLHTGLLGFDIMNIEQMWHNGMVSQAYHVHRHHLFADLRCNSACHRHPKTNQGMYLAGITSNRPISIKVLMLHKKGIWRGERRRLNPCFQASIVHTCRLFELCRCVWKARHTCCSNCHFIAQHTANAVLIVAA